MKKIINEPGNVVPEMVDGLVRAYPQYLRQIPETMAVIRSNEDSMAGKVGSFLVGALVMSLPMLVLLDLGCCLVRFVGKSLRHQLLIRSMKQSRQQIMEKASF